MAAVVRRKEDHDPGTCPVCDAPRTVLEWRKITMQDGTYFVPGKHACSARCHEKMSLEEWNRLMQKAVEEGRAN